MDVSASPETFRGSTRIEVDLHALVFVYVGRPVTWAQLSSGCGSRDPWGRLCCGQPEARRVSWLSLDVAFVTSASMTVRWL